MKVVTLRKLPAKLAKAIRQEANRKGTSINKAVISLLENRATVRSKNRLTLHEDLDSLAGSWSKKEAADFDKALAAQRTIDPELWK
jgi:phosphopantetheinyl transferase (holo-ACP synthase)